MGMTTRSTEIRFLTPAFLGNAAQSGQWRTPPFKALLRQWWRVAMAEQYGFRIDHRELCRLEADLFGSAAGNQGQRSRVRLRLSRWDEGALKKDQWRPLGGVKHPEVKVPAIDAGLYLGFGPVELPKGARQPVLKRNAAIQAGESAQLHLAFPDEAGGEIDRAIELMHRFGTLGGRSRNGWGSVAFADLGNGASLPLRDWQACLELDWAHAIGRDDKGPLVWRTSAYDDWQGLMVELAKLKIGFRTRFPFTSGRNAQRPEERHWLSYPVTHHSVRGWGNNRIPNTLRFKVVEDADGRLRGQIFHMPALPYANFRPEPREIERVWSQVHRYLDNAGLERIKG